MSNPEVVDKIEKYLLGKLEVEERAAFEQEMQQDTALAEEVALHREIHSRLGDQQYQKVAMAKEAAAAQYFKERARLTVIRRLTVGFAAAAVLVFAFLFITSPTQETDQLEQVAALIEPYPAQVFRSADDEVTSLQPGINYYTKGQYDDAARAFSEVEQSDKFYQTARFYQGVSEVLATDYLAGINTLEQYLSAENPGKKQEAEWYLAVAYVSAGQPDAARPLLRRLKSSGNAKIKGQATQLLDILS